MARADEPGIADPVDEAMTVAAPTFETFFLAEYRSMVLLAAAVSGSRNDAEDIAATALGRLQRDWSRISAYDKPGAWLRRVTINLALSHKRRFIAEAWALLRLGPRDDAVLAPVRSEHEPLWAAVAALPANQRAAVALRYLEDRSTEEIAEILEISASTVRTHMERAHRTLRAALRDAGFDPKDKR